MMQSCPRCSGPLDRDEVDIGVGTLYGPAGCPHCHWTERMEPRAELVARLQGLRREVTLTQAMATHARRLWIRVSTNGHGKSIAITTPEARALRLARVIGKKRARLAQEDYRRQFMRAVTEITECALMGTPGARGAHWLEEARELRAAIARRGEK